MGSADLFLVGGVFSISVVVYSLASFLAASGKTEKDVLSWANGDEPIKSKSGLINFSRPLVHQLTLKFAFKYKNADYRKKVQKMLMTGGLSRELNVDEFIGLQILWGFLLPAIFAFANMIMAFGIPYFLFLVMIPGGIWLPGQIARGEKARREISVRADLPFFADLLSLSTEAGLDFISAIQRIVDKAEDSVLAEELGNVLRDIKLGSSRADALKGMSTRLEVPEITSFVAVLVDADATGASISQVLKDQSVQIRLERFVRAEKAGARASQIILLPMMLFIMPAVFLVIFGPMVLQFVYGGK
jgi:tight adherence protein C